MEFTIDLNDLDVTRTKSYRINDVITIMLLHDSAFAGLATFSIDNESPKLRTLSDDLKENLVGKDVAFASVNEHNGTLQVITIDGRLFILHGLNEEDHNTDIAISAETVLFGACGGVFTALNVVDEKALIVRSIDSNSVRSTMILLDENGNPTNGGILIISEGEGHGFYPYENLNFIDNQIFASKSRYGFVINGSIVFNDGLIVPIQTGTFKINRIEDTRAEIFSEGKIIDIEFEKTNSFVQGDVYSLTRATFDKTRIAEEKRSENGISVIVPAEKDKVAVYVESRNQFSIIDVEGNVVDTCVDTDTVYVATDVKLTSFVFNGTTFDETVLFYIDGVKNINFVKTTNEIRYVKENNVYAYNVFSKETRNLGSINGDVSAIGVDPNGVAYAIIKTVKGYELKIYDAFNLKELRTYDVSISNPVTSITVDDDDIVIESKGVKLKVDKPTVWSLAHPFTLIDEEYNHKRIFSYNGRIYLYSKKEDRYLYVFNEKTRYFDRASIKPLGENSTIKDDNVVGCKVFEDGTVYIVFANALSTSCTVTVVSYNILINKTLNVISQAIDYTNKYNSNAVVSSIDWFSHYFVLSLSAQTQDPNTFVFDVYTLTNVSTGLEDTIGNVKKTVSFNNGFVTLNPTNGVTVTNPLNGPKAISNEISSTFPIFKASEHSLITGTGKALNDWKLSETKSNFDFKVDEETSVIEDSDGKLYFVDSETTKAIKTSLNLVKVLRIVNGYTIKVYSGRREDIFVFINPNTEEIVDKIKVNRNSTMWITDIAKVDSTRYLVLYNESGMTGMLSVFENGDVSYRAPWGTMYGKAIKNAINSHTVQEIDITCLYDNGDAEDDREVLV